MTKEDVIKKMCILASIVGTDVFADQYAHDCFCEVGTFKSAGDFRFDNEVIKFIEEAVMAKVNEGKKCPTCGGTKEKPQTFGKGFDYVEGYDCINKEFHT